MTSARAGSSRTSAIARVQGVEQKMRPDARLQFRQPGSGAGRRATLGAPHQCGHQQACQQRACKRAGRPGRRSREPGQRQQTAAIQAGQPPPGSPPPSTAPSAAVAPAASSDCRPRSARPAWPAAPHRSRSTRGPATPGSCPCRTSPPRPPPRPQTARRAESPRRGRRQRPGCRPRVPGPAEPALGSNPGRSIKFADLSSGERARCAIIGDFPL